MSSNDNGPHPAHMLLICMIVSVGLYKLAPDFFASRLPISLISVSTAASVAGCDDVEWASASLLERAHNLSTRSGSDGQFQDHRKVCYYVVDTGGHLYLLKGNGQVTQFMTNVDDPDGIIRARQEREKSAAIETYHVD